MKCYAIQDGELNNISGHNRTATIAFSIGSAFFAAALTIWLESKFNTPVTPEMITLVYWGPKFSLVAGLACYVFAGNALWTRRSIIDTVRKESD